MKQAIFFGLLAASLPSVAIAQNIDCNSRTVEQNLQRAVAEKMGPSAFAQIQAIGEGGRAPTTRVTVLNVDTVQTFTDGYRCRAAVSVWREDTNQTQQATATYLVYSRGGLSLENVQR
jgi:hypothetical protein